MSKRRNIEISGDTGDTGVDTGIVSSFKRINLESDNKREYKEYSLSNEYDRNNLNFMTLVKSKNILNNVSKLAKKQYTLTKKVDTFEKKINTIISKLDIIHKNIKKDDIKEDDIKGKNKMKEMSIDYNEDTIEDEYEETINKKLMYRFNSLEEKIENFIIGMNYKMNVLLNKKMNDNNVEDIVIKKINEDKIRSHKLEEYGFYS